ncbi:MAG: UDP-N-acetylmuramate--L-alanine ligase [Clostridiales bacterium]|nr:UDP-N-acetylmuramate--L-alanine ligase [Candidatus Coliplasma equi]
MNINDIPVKSNLYFLGIGGVSMSAIALILAGKGYKISGYDRAPSVVTSDLSGKGITVYFDFSEEQLKNIDYIVYSAAFGPDHEIMKSCVKSGKPLISRAEVLGALAKQYKNSVAVAGTHGKSTTSGMLAHTFINAVGCDPTAVIGATMLDASSTFRIGSDDNFIFEACEYKDSFLSFFPRIAVTLNIALDHTDYFHSIEQMKDSFVQYMNNAGKDGYAVYNLDDENCVDVAEKVIAHKITFSAAGNENADFYAKNVIKGNGHPTFDVYKRGKFMFTVTPGAPGNHNVSNSLAAIAVCDISGLSEKDTVSGIESFEGVGRRFQHIAKFCGADVFDDYAHHPDEIKATLSTAKQMPYKRVICVFQPHNYSRLLDLYDDFKVSFTDADKLILCPLYAAREACGDEVSSEKLAKEIGAEYYETFDEIKKRLSAIAEEGDLILIMGAGDIYKLANSFKQQ